MAAPKWEMTDTDSYAHGWVNTFWGVALLVSVGKKDGSLLPKLLPTTQVRAFVEKHPAG